MADDWTTAPLGEDDRLLCETAERLARSSSGLTDGDIDRLRDRGFSDRAIHDLIQVIAYFSYINRVAGGLGIGPEEWLPPLGSER